MINKKSFLITIINSFILLCIVVFLFYHLKTEKENSVVYVDNIRLFNDFNMTKDLNQLNRIEINKQKKKIDSLYTLYQIFEENKKETKQKELEILLRKEDQELKKMNDLFSKDVGVKVWNRLNEYLKKYGESNHYTIVIGTQGNGNVMYADSSIDITNSFIQYSNDLYEGNLN